nr:immunoglobulin heavy chain junction region [Mus musculus]
CARRGHYPWFAYW